MGTGSGQAGKRMGNEGASGHRVGTTDRDIPDESDLAQQIQGDNQLQGNDQKQVRNQRGNTPMENDRTEGVVESFERRDPKKRA